MYSMTIIIYKQPKQTKQHLQMSSTATATATATSTTPKRTIDQVDTSVESITKKPRINKYFYVFGGTFRGNEIYCFGYSKDPHARLNEINNYHGISTKYKIVRLYSTPFGKQMSDHVYKALSLCKEGNSFVVYWSIVESIINNYIKTREKIEQITVISDRESLDGILKPTNIYKLAYKTKRYDNYIVRKTNKVDDHVDTRGTRRERKYFIDSQNMTVGQLKVAIKNKSIPLARNTPKRPPYYKTTDLKWDLNGGWLTFVPPHSAEEIVREILGDIITSIDAHVVGNSNVV